jgi:hypothetical protein
VPAPSTWRCVNMHAIVIWGSFRAREQPRQCRLRALCGRTQFLFSHFFRSPGCEAARWRCPGRVLGHNPAKCPTGRHALATLLICRAGTGTAPRAVALGMCAHPTFKKAPTVQRLRQQTTQCPRTSLQLHPIPPQRTALRRRLERAVRVGRIGGSPPVEDSGPPESSPVEVGNRFANRAFCQVGGMRVLMGVK